MTSYRRWPACVAAACALLSLALAPAPAPQAARTDAAAMRAEVRRVERKLPKVRQLKFRKSVPVVEMTRAQAMELMEKDLVKNNPSDQIRADGAAGVLLGLYPNGIDLENVTLEMFRSQVAAFYDIERKRMVMVTGNWNSGIPSGSGVSSIETRARENMVVAHELTHALQDQNFNLGRMLDATKGNSDRQLALRCLMEGDATLSGFEFLAGGRMTEQMLDAVMSRLSELPQLFAAQSASIPEGVSEPLIFQYDDGLRFVAQAWRHGGWAAVDALYRKPPLSSAQIIDPALYYKHFTPPRQVTLLGYRAPLRGWSKADEDTMGELIMRIILKRNLGPASPHLALAYRWAGDREVILAKDGVYTVLWLIAFRDAASARQFATVYGDVLDRLPSSHLPHSTHACGEAVLVEAGSGAAQGDRIAAAVFRKSTVDGRTLALSVGCAAAGR